MSGNAPKLRGSPKAKATKPLEPIGWWPRRDRGHGNKAFGCNNGQSAAKPLSREAEGKVQRLDGCGSCVLLVRTNGLRYSPPPQKWEPRPKPSRGPEVEGHLHAKPSGRELGYSWRRQMLDQRTTGITGLWQPSVHSDVAF